MTTSFPRGISTSMFFKLCCRAPRIRIASTRPQQSAGRKLPSLKRFMRSPQERAMSDRPAREATVRRANRASHCPPMSHGPGEDDCPPRTAEFIPAFIHSSIHQPRNLRVRASRKPNQAKPIPTGPWIIHSGMAARRRRTPEEPSRSFDQACRPGGSFVIIQSFEALKFPQIQISRVARQRECPIKSWRANRP